MLVCFQGISSKLQVPFMVSHLLIEDAERKWKAACLIAEIMARYLLCVGCRQAEAVFPVHATGCGLGAYVSMASFANECVP